LMLSLHARQTRLHYEEEGRGERTASQQQNQENTDDYPG
jgi:hypothetical protein